MIKDYSMSYATILYHVIRFYILTPIKFLENFWLQVVKWRPCLSDTRSVQSFTPFENYDVILRVLLHNQILLVLKLIKHNI